MIILSLDFHIAVRQEPSQSGNPHQNGRRLTGRNRAQKNATVECIAYRYGAALIYGLSTTNIMQTGRMSTGRSNILMQDFAKNKLNSCGMIGHNHTHRGAWPIVTLFVYYLFKRLSDNCFGGLQSHDISVYRPVILSRCSGYRAPCRVIFKAALSISRRSSFVN